MKTILIFSWFYVPYLGGAELFVKAITERLSRRFRFVIVTARAQSKLPRIEEHDGTRIVRVGLGRAIDKFLYPAAGTLRALRLPPADLVHAIMVNASALAAFGYTRIRNKPTLLTLQEGDSEDYVKRYLGPFFPMYRRLHRSFDRIHAISRHLERQAIQYGADATTIRVVPNGVDEHVFRPAPDEESRRELREELGVRNRRVVVSVSRLVAKNGLDRLIEAMATVRTRHPEAMLVLVGDGPERAALASKARALDLEDHVRFEGERAHEDTARYLQSADVFCRPSRSEGLGSAFLEAMAAGVPVVATPVGGIPDFLRDGENGLSVDPPTADGVAAAIDRLLSDDAMAHKLSGAARELVRERYLWDGVAGEIGAMYDELLA